MVLRCYGVTDWTKNERKKNTNDSNAPNASNNPKKL